MTSPGPPPLADLPLMNDVSMDNDTKKIPTTNTRPGVIAKGMTSVYGAFALPLGLVNMRLASSVVENAENCGEQWERLAKTNPKVRKFLLGAMEGAGWFGVAMAHLPFAYVILAEYGPLRLRTALGMMDAVSAMGDSNGAHESV